ncbi:MULTISPECIES: Gfo/Idh/MocA family oxidoreductase [unclassified Streptomyces]|uniref:Gfo/Idh/MocA family protein n=1 Tax=unclassified Streptomyces TaxID=2593676 RepID=UPI002E805126|nr:Gfo/Idh/MocA family oxidoreductase [Streptomyces sp. NBC_00562]WUC23986.1 Gfo/Idh/MocA family oxidoreductase [Streptomyces sp. NBC_00562]
MNTIGVGIIGGSQGGWASISHIPALKALPDFELRAVSTSRQESANAAGKEFGVEATFDNHADLLAHPGVDVVVVAVKVPHHRELISAAIDAGKTVYAEWPLALNLAEATELTRRAEAAGVRTAIGLQGRYHPELRYARRLVEDGRIGRVLGTSMVASGMVWGGETTRAHAYWYDRTQGATSLSGAALHAIDALNVTLGQFGHLSADLVLGRTQVTVTDDGNTVVPVTAPDQVSLIGTLDSGAAASVFYRGGTSRGDNFRWEINGTDGDLVLTAPWGNLQVTDLTLQAGFGTDTTVSPLEVPAAYSTDIPTGLTGPARNVAALYTHLGRDLREGTRTVPDFAYAHTRHQLLDAINRSSTEGAAQTLA